MPIKVRVLETILLLACTGCGPSLTSVTFLSPPPPPRPPYHPIQLYNETRPECPFQEVGSVSARKPSGLVSMEKVTEGLRQRAREMGGDAIIGVTMGTVHGGGTVVGNSVIADNDPVVSGTVIRFRDSTCTH